MFKVNLSYLLLTFVLLVAEILIALYTHDAFVRPYVGDYLVVILIYSFLRSFFDVPVRNTALAVLLFAYLVEYLQYLHFIRFLGLEDSGWAAILMGNAFAWMDIAAYTAGILTVLIVSGIIKRLTVSREIAVKTIRP